MQPSAVKSVNFQKSILPKPAGSEMNVRTMGSMREKKTTGAPQRSNQCCAVSRWCGRSSTYLPQRSTNGRPP